MADAMDSKSIVRKDVWVRLPPPVSSSLAITCGGFFLLIGKPSFLSLILCSCIKDH